MQRSGIFDLLSSSKPRHGAVARHAHTTSSTVKTITYHLYSKYIFCCFKEEEIHIFILFASKWNDGKAKDTFMKLTIYKCNQPSSHLLMWLTSSIFSVNSLQCKVNTKVSLLSPYICFVSPTLLTYLWYAFHHYIVMQFCTFLKHYSHTVLQRSWSAFQMSQTVVWVY